MARARILVIDDDPLFRNLLGTVLRRHYLVSAAGDGAEGYYKSIERPPDLVVLDVKMPNWDGLRTLRAFRAHAALCAIPIVLLTGDRSKETVLAAIQEGVSDYVLKSDFQKEEFLSKISWLLEQRPDQNAPHVRAVAAPPVAPAPKPVDSDMQAIMDGWE